MQKRSILHMKNFKLIIGILCPVLTVASLLVTIINATIDNKTKRKQLKTWDNPDRVYQAVGVGMEFQRERFEEAKQNSKK